MITVLPDLKPGLTISNRTLFLTSLIQKKTSTVKTPMLARIINQNPRLQAIVQNSFPSLAVITFNGLLPFFLSCALMELVSGPPDVADYTRAFIRTFLRREYSAALLDLCPCSNESPSIISYIGCEP
jgi:hypothetical protein